MTTRLSVAPASGGVSWLTSGEAARMLQLTPRGVRWLAHARTLRGERTASEQWLFRRSEVLQLVAQRAQARIRTRAEVWRTLRIVRASVEPRQLALPLFGEAKGRKVTSRSGSETAPNVEQPGVSPIRRILLTDGGAKRMAKAEVDGGRRRARS